MDPATLTAYLSSRGFDPKTAAKQAAKILENPDDPGNAGYIQGAQAFGVQQARVHAGHAAVTQFGTERIDTMSQRLGISQQAAAQIVGNLYSPHLQAIQQRAASTPIPVRDPMQIGRPDVGSKSGDTMGSSYQESQSRWLIGHNDDEKNYRGNPKPIYGEPGQHRDTNNNLFFYPNGANQGAFSGPSGVTPQDIAAYLKMQALAPAYGHPTNAPDERTPVQDMPTPPSRRLDAESVYNNVVTEGGTDYDRDPALNFPTVKPQKTNGEDVGLTPRSSGGYDAYDLGTKPEESQNFWVHAAQKLRAKRDAINIKQGINPDEF